MRPTVPGRSGSSAPTPTAPTCGSSSTPTGSSSGWQVVALQPYGGAWLNSWLDRDLGISGRLSVRVGNTIDHRLVRIDEPILRVPQLAIHLAEDRKSVSLDPQRHVNAVWGVGSGTRSFLGYVAEQAGVDAADVLGVDLMTHDLTPSTLAGPTASCSARRGWTTRPPATPGLEAFLAAEPRRAHAGAGAVRPRGGRLAVRSRRAVRAAADGAGARSRWPRAAAGEDFLRRLPGSMVASGDMAHATHPNYPERHEPGHLIEVNAGPVLKVQPNLRYATDGRTAAAFALACEQAGCAAAALRASGRPAVRVDDRADDLGAHRHPDGRRRRGPAGHALGARGDGRRRRRRLLGGAEGVFVTGLI